MEIEEKDYTCRAFFPRSLSAVHPETLMRIVLQSFVERAPNADHPKHEARRVAKKALRKLASTSEVSQDTKKRNLLCDWIDQDLCFTTTAKHKETKEPIHFLLPYTMEVGGLKWKAQEGYDKVIHALARSGRQEADLEVNAVLQELIDILQAEGGGVGADLLREALPKVEAKSFSDPDQFDDNLFCKPHARLFQEDIELLAKWKLPRGQQLELLKHLISFHMCAYLARMAKAADWVSKATTNKLDSWEAYRSEEMPCVACREKYRKDPGRFQQLAQECEFHPHFAVGDVRSQEWHEVLIRYHKNIAHINLSLRLCDLPSRDRSTPENVFELLKKISSDPSIRTKILEQLQGKEKDSPGKLLQSMVDKKFDENPPKGHAWDFFRRFGPSKEAGFMSKPHRMRMKVALPPALLNAWGHIFLALRDSIAKSALFVEFLNFMRSRGFEFGGKGLEQFENSLRTIGLLREYADMGFARVLEAVFPVSSSKEGKDAGSKSI